MCGKCSRFLKCETFQPEKFTIFNLKLLNVKIISSSLDQMATTGPFPLSHFPGFSGPSFPLQRLHTTDATIIHGSCSLELPAAGVLYVHAVMSGMKSHNQFAKGAVALGELRIQKEP